MNSLWVIISVIVAIIGFLIAVFAWFFPRRAKLQKAIERLIEQIKEKIETVDHIAKEANENIKKIEKHLGIPIYLDGLPSASSRVRDPYAKGLKLMVKGKWSKAITEFKVAMKKATDSHKVALYIFLGHCYTPLGELDLALDSYNNSLAQAITLHDKQGHAAALRNLSLIHDIRGDLDKALKYREDASKIEKEMEKTNRLFLVSLCLIFGILMGTPIGAYFWPKQNYEQIEKEKKEDRQGVSPYDSLREVILNIEK